MNRKRLGGSSLHLRSSIYSRTDIQEQVSWKFFFTPRPPPLLPFRKTPSPSLQMPLPINNFSICYSQYCLSERQRNRVKRSKLEGFFGCVSSHSNNQKLFGFCVGHGSSDENLASAAPFHRERG